MSLSNCTRRGCAGYEESNLVLFGCTGTRHIADVVLVQPGHDVRYLSVCAGIEAATVAWHPLGWQPVAFSEIEKFPCAVLQHHYPDVPNWGDMNDFKNWPDATFDVLVGGTPCQSFSVAGLRQGMDDPRGNLALVYLAIAQRYRPNWLVWENVPGVLSSDGGRDFAAIIGGMVKLGYGIAYRVLDAQYFGVPQRRRRVFVVGCLGGWKHSAEVLFEPESLRRNPAPSREKGQDITPTIRAGAANGGAGHGARSGDSKDELIIPVIAKSIGAGGNLKFREDQDTLIPDTSAPVLHGAGNSIVDPDLTTYLPDKKWPADVAASLNAAFSTKQGLEDQHALGGASWFVPAVGPLTAKGPQAMDAPEVDANHYIPVANEQTPIVVHGTQDPIVSDQAHPLQVINGGLVNAVAHSIRMANTSSNGCGIQEEVSHTLDQTSGPAIAFAQNQEGEVRCSDIVGTVSTNSNASGRNTPMLSQDMAVRRLTPMECERLQGFPDGYTNIPGASDSGRYKALGNSMAVPVMHWIGRRINEMR